MYVNTQVCVCHVFIMTFQLCQSLCVLLFIHSHASCARFFCLFFCFVLFCFLGGEGVFFIRKKRNWVYILVKYKLLRSNGTTGPACGYPNSYSMVYCVHCWFSIGYSLRFAHQPIFIYLVSPFVAVCAAHCSPKRVCSTCRHTLVLIAPRMGMSTPDR